jgi:ABC-type cobalt transport system substrate-binding protein
MLSVLKIISLVFLLQLSIASRAHDHTVEFYGPTKEPTTTTPTYEPMEAPTFSPTGAPTFSPSEGQTEEPTSSPTESPFYSRFRYSSSRFHVSS